MLVAYAARLEEEICFIEQRSFIGRMPFSMAAQRPDYIQDALAFVWPLIQELDLHVQQVVMDPVLSQLRIRAINIFHRLVAHSHAEAGPSAGNAAACWTGLGYAVASPATTFSHTSPATQFSRRSPVVSRYTRSPTTTLQARPPAASSSTRPPAASCSTRPPAASSSTRPPIANSSAVSPATRHPARPPPASLVATVAVPGSSASLPAAGLTAMVPETGSPAASFLNVVQNDDGVRFVPGLTSDPVPFSRAITPARYADVNGYLSPAGGVTGNHLVASSETMLNGTSSPEPLQSGLELAWPDFDANETGAEIDESATAAQQSTILPGLHDSSLLPRLELRQRRLANGAHQEPHANGTRLPASADAATEESSPLATMMEASVSASADESLSASTEE